MVSQCRLRKLSLFLNVIAVAVAYVCCEWTCTSTISVRQICGTETNCVEKYDETTDSCDLEATLPQRNVTETASNPILPPTATPPTPTIETDNEDACLVPTIKNGRMLTQTSLSFPNINTKPGDLVPNQTWAFYECDSGFNLEGRENNLCRSGSWFSKIHPICTRYCRNDDLMLNSVSYTVRCLENGGVTVPCNDRIKPGTIARSTCSTKYRIPYHNPVQSFFCNEIGRWDYHPSRCEPICGEELPPSQPFHVNGKVTNITSVPWHVAVYQIKADRYEHICGGTIINAKVIISAAHCFWDNANEVAHSTRLYTIGAGKFFRDYYADESGRGQFRNVSSISIPTEYKGEYRSYMADISVLTLTSALYLSDFIAPICIEWQSLSAKNFRNNLYGTVAGWGLDETGGFSTELKTIYVPGHSYEACRSAAGRRLESTITDDKFCVLNSFASNPCEGDSGGGFVVKKEVNGTLWKSSCVAVGSVMQSYCDNSLLNGVTFKAECIHMLETVPCNDSIKPGTVVRINCSPNYRLPEEAQQSLMCLENGEWDYNPPPCLQTCGEASEQVQQTKSTTLMPWHVGIYRKITGKYNYICGGTIINAKLVISVAHCFLEEANHSINDKSSYIIAAGAGLSREFNANESNGEQLRNISQIIVHPAYRGSLGNFKADIAVIVLSNPLVFSAFIAPVCIQWERGSVKDFLNNLYGTVTIWSTGQSELKTISVPGSSYAVCLEETNDQSPSVLTSDKFCILNSFNEIPCLRSSGSGFVVEKFSNGKTRHFLMGLVSIGWPSPQNNNCNNTRFIGMTNIQFYQNFIVDLINQNRVK